jgi:chitodextrinase
MKRILLVLGLALYWLGSSFANSPRETHELLCSAPTQIAAISAENGLSAKVTFPISGASSYVIEYRLGYDSTWKSRTVLPTSASTLIIDGLRPCAWYVIRVKALCSPNESSDWSRISEFKTGGCTVACPIPTGLFASTRDSIASLNWLATNTSAGYSVMWKPKRSTVWKTENVTTNTLILRGLSPCTEYEFKVKALCGLTGSSEHSEAKSFKTLGCVAPCLTPRELKGEGGESKIGIAWASTGARIYEIQYKNAADSSAWVSVRSTVNSMTINPLRPCTKYFIKVRSICSGEGSTSVLYSEWSSQIVVATTGCVLPNRCEPVRRLGYQPTANGAVLVWEAITGAKFELQYKAKLDSTWKTVSTNRSGYELTGLLSCTEYQYRVRVYCANGGTSAWSSVLTFKTGGCQAVCKAPTAVKTFSVDSIAVITWAATSTSRFMLQYKLADAVDYTTLNVTGNVYVLTGLKRCATYYIRVKSVCSTTSMSDYTEIAKFSTGGCQPTTCAKPTQLTGSADQTAAKFVWSNTNVRAYLFEYRIYSDVETRWVADTVISTSTAIFNLKPCTKYAARVRSLCATGASEPSDVFYFTTTCPPVECKKPIDLNGSADQTAAKFIWSNTGARGYLFEYRIYSDVDTRWMADTVTSTSTAIFNLKPCTKYAARVRSLCATGASEPSDVFYFTTTGCTPDSCSAPLRGSSQLVNDNLIYLSWTNTGGKYEVQYRVTTSNVEYTSVKTDSSSLKLELKPCQIYEWKVRTICANGSVSAWSESRKFETKGCTPVTCEAPTNLTHELIVTNEDNQTAYFSWKSSSIVTVVERFEIQYRLTSITSAGWMTDSISGYHYKAPVRRCQVYEWRVRKICGNGLYSAWVYGKFETKCTIPPACTLPTLPVVKAGTDGTVALYWENLIGRDTFILQYRSTTDSLWKELIVAPTPNGVILMGILPCKEYKVRLRRICADGTNQWAETSFKVPGVNCLTDGSNNGGDVQVLAVRKNPIKTVGISPNPGSDFIQVQYELQEASEVSISLMNLQGQVVNQFNGGKQDAGVYMQTLDNLSELNTGLYMLVIRANGKISVSQKWMKQ